MTVWLEIIAFRPLSLAPPTTPCLVRCAFIQLCIQPHPRLIPPSALIIIFPPRVTSLRRRLFLRNPSTDDNERRNKESRKLDRPASISPLLLLLCPSSPNLDWRVCFFEKFARRGGGGGNVIVDLPLCWSKWKPRWTKSGEFASIRSKSLRFLSSSYRTGDDRPLFEIQSVGQDDREFMNEPVTQWSTYFLEIAFVARLKFWHSSANAKCARAKGPRITM